MTTDAARSLELAGGLAELLPDAPAAVNLCERRDNFLISFVAMLMKAQTCLMPPSRASAIVAEVVAENPGSYVLDDVWVERARAMHFTEQTAFPFVPPDRVVAIGYTSGSTGRPRPNPKTWGGFAVSSANNATALRSVPSACLEGRQAWIVATVPPQHMYGMEFSVLLPLLAGIGVHGGQPLFPADISSALAEVPAPRILVSTPAHLRTLVESGVELAKLGAVVSATAPLSTELAVAIEERFSTVLVEFFGSTETCVIASRRTACTTVWTPYPDVLLQPVDGGTIVNAPWLMAATVLQDILEVQPDGTFSVRGRNADLVEVAGKRASLADLTRRLTSIPGVSDAVVFQPDEADTSTVRRLAALVVADGMTEADVRERLAPAVDPVFLPRPIVLVAKLPRNEVGKLPRAQLLAALRR